MTLTLSEWDSRGLVAGVVVERAPDEHVFQFVSRPNGGILTH